jgi:class 3 adenylate cyclase
MGEQGSMLDELERFVTGTVREREIDRMFATVVFTDIVGSTERLAAVGDQAWRKLVEEHDRCVRLALVEHGGREVKTLGDGFLMTFPAPHGALRALKDIHHDVHQLGLEIRAGVHTGEVEIVGADLAGLTVNTAARISALAGAGEVLVSETVRDLLRPSGTECVTRGSHDLKGVPGRQQLFAAAEPSRIAVEVGGPKIRVRDRMLLSMARRAPGLARSFTARLQTRTAPAA